MVQSQRQRVGINDEVSIEGVKFLSVRVSNGLGLLRSISDYPMVKLIILFAFKVFGLFCVLFHNEICMQSAKI